MAVVGTTHSCRVYVTDMFTRDSGVQFRGGAYVFPSALSPLRLQDRPRLLSNAELLPFPGGKRGRSEYD